MKMCCSVSTRWRGGGESTSDWLFFIQILHVTPSSFPLFHSSFFHPLLFHPLFNLFLSFSLTFFLTTHQFTRFLSLSLKLPSFGSYSSSLIFICYAASPQPNQSLFTLGTSNLQLFICWKILSHPELSLTLTSCLLKAL